MKHVCKWLIKAMFFLNLFVLGFTHTEQAQATTTDFSQSSISTGISALNANILALIPDPDVSYSSIISYTSLVPSDNSDDNSAPLTNLIRRNTTSATLTNTLFTYMDGSGASDGPLPLIPIASDSTYTLNLSVTNVDPTDSSTDPIFKFYVTPTSDRIWSLGTTIGIKTLILSDLASVTMSDSNFDNNVGRSVNEESLPYVRFYDAVTSFNGGGPASVLASEIPVDPASPDGERYVAYYVAMVSGSGAPSSPGGVVNTLLNVGTPTPVDPNDSTDQAVNAANEMPYLADLNGDGFQELVLVINTMNLDIPKSYIMIMLGNGDGTFGSPVTHALTDNLFVFGISSGDMDGDGSIDLITSIVEGFVGGNSAPTNPQLNIIKKPLTDFNMVTALSPNDGALPTFVHNLDCNIDGSPDIVAVEIEVTIDSTLENNNTTVQAGNVVCYLNNGSGSFSNSSALIIYPKELLQVSVSIGGETSSLQNVILQSKVGDIGCGQGWFGDIFYAVGGDGGGGSSSVSGDLTYSTSDNSFSYPGVSMSSDSSGNFTITDDQTGDTLFTGIYSLTETTSTSCSYLNITANEDSQVLSICGICTLGSLTDAHFGYASTEGTTCDTMSLSASTSTASSTTSGFNSVLMAQHSDCDAVIEALARLDPGTDLEGGPCALSLKANSSFHISYLLNYFMIFGILGFFTYKNRRQTPSKNLFSCQGK